MQMFKRDDKPQGLSPVIVVTEGGMMSGVVLTQHALMSCPVRLLRSNTDYVFQMRLSVRSQNPMVVAL